MLDDPAVFLGRPGEIPRDIFQGDNREIEAVAEADKPGRFDRGVDVEASCKHHRLVRHDAYRMAIEPGKADDDVLGEMLLHLEEVPIVHDQPNQLLHIVWLVRILGDQRVEALFHPLGIVGRLPPGRAFHVILREEAQELPNGEQALLFRIHREVGHPGGRVVGHRPSELLKGDLFLQDRLDHIGAGDEHVARPLHHDDEVHQGRRIDRPPGAGSHDRRDLGDDPRGQDVPQEDIGIAGEGVHPLLDPGAPRIVEADEGHTHLDRQVHDLADLLCVGHAERSTEAGEIIGEDVHRPPLDRAMPDHDAIAGELLLLHPEIGAAVGDQHVHFRKASRIEQHIEPFPRGEFAGLVLPFDPFGTSTRERCFFSSMKLLELLFVGHRPRLLSRIPKRGFFHISAPDKCQSHI